MTTVQIKEDATRLLNRINVLFDSDYPIPANEVKSLLELQKQLNRYHEAIK